VSILITGGTGRLGTGLARELVGRGEKAVLFDVATREERLTDIKDKVKVVLGDLKVWPEVMNVVKDNNVEGIFHHGSMLSLPSDENPWASFQTNVMGTMHVLEAARLFGVKRVVFASTEATYGLGTTGVITEETLQRPITMYGAGKLYGELLGRFYRRKFGLDFRAIRYFTVLYPGAKVRALPTFMHWMIEHAALGKPFECYVSEDAVQPVTYYRDAIMATIMLYYAPKEKIKTVCYNLAGVSPAPSAKALELAVRKFVPDAKITYKPDPAVMEYYRTRKADSVDDSPAQQEWGWKPSNTPLEKVVEDFIHEVRTRPEVYGLK
jgi:nucleoside-diphosphate-sugar epimerase